MKVLRGVLVFLFILGLGLGAALPLLERSYKAAAREVCDLLETNYYKANDPLVKPSILKCRTEAETQAFVLSKQKNIDRLNARLAVFRSSHLMVYSPDENRALWENEGLDTGLRSRFVEEFMVVKDVLPESPADRSGIKVGDVLELLNETVIASPFDAQTGYGVFTVARQIPGEKEMKRFTVELTPEELQEDLSPTIEEITGDTGYLRIPSFLSQYFEESDWEDIAKVLPTFKKLVIDVRENAGGSFPAMMRALSPFRCGRPLIGSIRRPFREGMKASTDLLDDLKTESQLEQLSQAAVVNLRTFKRYGCFDGPVTVLIDSGTASTAEIFAQAFYSRPQSRVWGQMSSGQVVLAQWFPLPLLGSDAYSMSVPIASYHTADGADLENVGLVPQRELQYTVESALRGEDNWVEASRRW